MTNEASSKPLRLYLARLQTQAQNLEVMINQAISETDQEGREAAAVKMDFATFVKSWTEMIPTVHDLADEAGVDLAVFASGLADLLLTIQIRLAHNEELREMMQKSLTDGIADVRTLEQNIQYLNEVTPPWIANYLGMIRSKGIMSDAIDIMVERGEPATDRLQWMSEALEKHGY